MIATRNRREQTASAQHLAYSVSHPMEQRGVDNQLPKHGIVVRDPPAFYDSQPFGAKKGRKAARRVGPQMIRRLKGSVVGAVHQFAPGCDQRPMVRNVDMDQPSYLARRADKGLRIAEVFDHLRAKHHIELTRNTSGELARDDVRAGPRPGALGNIGNRLNARIAASYIVPGTGPRRVAAPNLQNGRNGTAQFTLVIFLARDYPARSHRFLRSDRSFGARPEWLVAFNYAVGAFGEHKPADQALPDRYAAMGNMAAVAFAARAVTHARSMPHRGIRAKQKANSA